MEDFEKLLAYIRRTNPGMTKDRFIEELGKCHYSAIALVMTWQNIEKQAS